MKRDSRTCSPRLFSCVDKAAITFARRDVLSVAKEITSKTPVKNEKKNSTSRYEHLLGHILTNVSGGLGLNYMQKGFMCQAG